MVKATSSKSQGYHHGNLRNALIDAGLALLREEGLEALSLRAAARRVGVSHASSYRHFADKRALLAAIAEQGFDLLSTEMHALSAPFGNDIKARLTACGVAYVRFALAHADHFHVMFIGGSDSRAPFPDLRAAADRAYDVLVAAVRAGQDAGIVQAGDARIMALAAWAQVHGLATLLLERQLTTTAHRDLDGELLARRCAALLFHGIRAASA